MKLLRIEGGKPLEGELEISGAKNAALPIMAATLLSDGVVTLDHVPSLTDISVMAEILTELGVSIISEPGGRMVTRVVNEDLHTAPYDLVKKMRGSFCVFGPLLAKRGIAKVSLPGGCVIGTRPIDLHLKGIRALGATIRLEDGYVIAEAPAGGLKGTRIYLGGNAGSTVLGTANVMCAAVFADGITTICHAAQEPEIEDLAIMLNKMGAHIRGAGTSTIEIEGVTSLGSCTHEIIPDRIEAGTWMAAVAAAGGNVLLKNAAVEHMDAVLDRFDAAGLTMIKESGGLRVIREKRLKGIDITALPYPGFPTDMQAQMMTVQTLADSASVITDRIFPDRFMHVPELNRMGADVVAIPGSSSVVVKPVNRLQPAEVMASDLRASAALVIAALAADGITSMHRIYHLDRGYEKLEAKLQKLGVSAWREEDSVKVSHRLKASNACQRKLGPNTGGKIVKIA